MRKLILLLSLILSTSIAFAQHEPNEEMSKREIRKEKKRAKEIKLEQGRQLALKGLKERDFAIRANQFINSDNEITYVSEDANGLIVDGDVIHIYQMDAPASSINQIGQELNFQGKIERIKITENNDGKRVDAVLYVTATHFPKPMTIFLKLFGENNEARLVLGSERYTIRGVFEPASESPLRSFPIMVPGTGSTGY